MALAGIFSWVHNKSCHIISDYDQHIPMDYHIYYIFLTVADRIHKNISISMSFHRMQMDTKIKKSMNESYKKIFTQQFSCT